MAVANQLSSQDAVVVTPSDYDLPFFSNEETTTSEPGIKYSPSMQQQFAIKALRLKEDELLRDPNNINLQRDVENARNIAGVSPKPEKETDYSLPFFSHEDVQKVETEESKNPAFGVGNAYTRKLAAQPRENRATGAPLAVAENVGSMIGNLGVQTLGSLKGVLGSIPEAIRTGQAPGPIGEKIRKEFVEKHQFAPTSELGQTMGEQIGGVIEANKMPPFVPGMMELAGVQAGKQVVETAKPKPLPAKISYADFQKMQQEKAQATQPIALAPAEVTPGRVSIGAAATAPENAVRAELAKASPERQELLKNKPPETFTPDELKALETHNQFEKFGMKATEGEALQNTSLMSRETNDRVKDPNLQARFEERDPKLIEGFETIKQNIAPDVYETDPVKMANMPLERMKADLLDHEQRIRAAYDVANNATGTGQSAIDVASLKDNIDAALRKKGKAKYLPAELRSDLEEALTKGYLTSEEYENFRTDTATIARTNQNPLARQAASIVREQLENVPLKGEFAKYKPLYDQARKLVVELKQKEKIPAYKAAASDTRTLEEIDAGIPHPAANTFLERHYGEKTPEVNIQRMLDIIGRDSAEHQALNAAKIDQFKLRSGIKNNQGKVSQAALNKIIFESHKSNLPVMFGNLAAKDLQDLAEVARKSEHVKGVHAVNVSNTEIIREANALQAAKEVAQSVAEGTLAVKTGGISSIVLPPLKRMFESKKKEAALTKEIAEKAAESERRLAPTAGIKINKMLP
jgi:hypothetical protein